MVDVDIAMKVLRDKNDKLRKATKTEWEYSREAPQYDSQIMIGTIIGMLSDKGKELSRGDVKYLSSLNRRSKELYTEYPGLEACGLDEYEETVAMALIYGAEGFRDNPETDVEKATRIIPRARWQRELENEVERNDKRAVDNWIERSVELHTDVMRCTFDIAATLAHYMSGNGLPPAEEEVLKAFEQYISGSDVNIGDYRIEALSPDGTDKCLDGTKGADDAILALMSDGKKFLPKEFEKYGGHRKELIPIFKGNKLVASVIHKRGHGVGQVMIPSPDKEYNPETGVDSYKPFDDPMEFVDFFIRNHPQPA
jgi:hypothetical protein